MVFAVGASKPLVWAGARTRPQRARPRTAAPAVPRSVRCRAAAGEGDAAQAASVADVAMPQGRVTDGGSEPGAPLPGEEVVRWTEYGAPIYEGYYEWKNGWRIRYQRSGDSGPPVLLVHGFGGNCDHWRKNTGELGKAGCRAFSIDLLGYGYSSKPSPKNAEPNSIYCFENWSEQLRHFIETKIGEPTAVVCNSVGGIAGLQAAVDDPSLVTSVAVLNISLRMLHVSKQAPLSRPFVAAFQRVLRETDIGKAFFGSVAQPRTVGNILRQAYHDPATVTDELVDCILKPGLQDGAVDVFLDFISYSGGPLPEDLLREVPVPTVVVWGDKDPWEKVEWGREFEAYPTVKEYIELPGVGHCPQDERPDLVNPVLLDFVGKYHRPVASG
ncbi:unnamed protein product [Pedinophyceae sp. YPF-701]|nr:unnamed protein product [Pedinophyceae sp. YPF-701]